MYTPTPSFSFNVDPTNPGQFFACCGMLELADRLWRGAEGWFDSGMRKFHIACGEHNLAELLSAIGNIVLQSSLGDEGLKRLGTLLSAAKASLTEHEQNEKDRLQQLWRVERISLSSPFNIQLDWWWDDLSGVTLLKTWAAKQLVLEIARPLVAAIRQIDWFQQDTVDCLTTTARITGLPFYFDADNNTQNTPRDFGAATADVKLAPNDRPLIEFLTFIALQRYRPSRSQSSQLIQYATWYTPQLPSVAAAIVAGRVDLPEVHRFAFRMLYRTKYMKAFLPSSHVSNTGDQ